MVHSNELWQEYDEQGRPLENGGRPAGHAPELEARSGHYAVACTWLYRFTPETNKPETPPIIEILFQKRSKFVDRNPEKWDVSAGGHVNYGESILDAAVRELHEEIGADDLAKDDLIFLYSRFWRTEKFHHLYVCNYTGREDNFHFDDQEVSEVKWVRLEDLKDFWQNFTKDSLAEDKIQYETLKAYFEGLLEDANH